MDSSARLWWLVAFGLNVILMAVNLAFGLIITVPGNPATATSHMISLIAAAIACASAVILAAAKGKVFDAQSPYGCVLLVVLILGAATAALGQFDIHSTAMSAVRHLRLLGESASFGLIGVVLYTMLAYGLVRLRRSHRNTTTGRGNAAHGSHD